MVCGKRCETVEEIMAKDKFGTKAFLKEIQHSGMRLFLQIKKGWYSQGGRVLLIFYLQIRSNKKWGWANGATMDGELLRTQKFVQI